MSAVNKKESYYKASIDPSLEQTLISKRVDTERFKRDLLLAQKEHAKTKKNEPFELSATMIKTLIAKQQAMFNLQSPERFLTHDRTREANEKLAKIREKARIARQKATTYSGKFEDKPESEQKKILVLFENTRTQSTIGMVPIDYVLRTTDDIMERLESHAKNRPYVQILIKMIRSELLKEEKKITSKQISIMEYVKNCQKIMDKHVPELKKPQTFFEAARHFLIHGLKSIFNIFDRLYTWLMSKDKTLAETPHRKMYIPDPQTPLAQEIEAIQKERFNFEKELKEQLEIIYEHEAKRARHLSQIALAKAGEHPEKNAFEERRRQKQLGQNQTQKTLAKDEENTPSSLRP